MTIFGSGLSPRRRHLAAMAQVYATLAVAAAIETAAISRGRPQIPGPGLLRR